MNLKILQPNLQNKFNNLKSKLSNINNKFQERANHLKEKTSNLKQTSNNFNEQKLLNKLSMNDLTPNRVTLDRIHKKRKLIIIASLVVFLLTIIITTATIIDKNKLVSQASCDAEATRVRNLEPLMNKDTSYLTKPYATTDFLQPWLFTDYTTNQIYEHIKMLKTAGYKNIVLQNVATISGGYKNDAKITSAWYETTLSTDTESLDIYNPTLLGTLIDAVTSLDMGIYIGPVITNDWLNGGYTNSTWIYSNATLINGIIKDIYSKYGNYSCFKGWYLGFDIYANNHQYEEHWIDLFNYILNFITTLESTGISHPVMITPSFNDSYQMKSSEVYAFWKNVVQNTNFRTNDIICFFDGLGTSHIKPNIITNYIIETKKAINSCPTDLDFWLCVENFRDINTSVKPADLVRYIIQLELCAKLTDTLASYSYSHYYNPKYVDSTYNTDYLTYLTESASNIKVNDNSLNKTNTSKSSKKNNNKTNSNKKHTSKSTGNSTKGISLEFENTNIATPTGGYIYKDKNGELAPIPSGFTVSSYANTINEGLVIKDKNQNEYVWIPVKDGIMSNGYSYSANNKQAIYYTRYTNSNINATSVSTDTLPNGVVSDTSQIEKYHGFYVGRYESSFNYNLGQPTCQIKYTPSNNVDLSFTWKYCNSNTYTGYTWNNITYTDAKNIAENMATKYNYNNSIKTGLINGTQWDTIMRFIETSSLVDNITTKSNTWGNFTDAATPANTLNYQMGILKPSGSNTKWSIKNIYDLSGNLSEWTSEISNNKHVIRSGSFNQKGAKYGASYSKAIANGEYTNVGFRIVLYLD